MKSGRDLALAATLLACAWPVAASAQAGSVMVSRAAPPQRLGPAFGPGGLPGVAGRGGNTNPGWSQANGVRLDLGHGRWRGRGNDGGQHGHGHGRDRGYGWGLGYGGYGGGLIEDPESFRDQGYFAGSANVWVEGGRAAYDYDRAYPYDWYREGSARTSLVRAEPRAPFEPEYRCSIERSGVRVCRGR